MTDYHADLLWVRAPGEDFLANRYSRRHRLRFDGGAEVAGSSSPHVVPLPWSDASAVDPEEMLVAALSSCHMLWFLSIAARRGFGVDRYADAAVGVMARNAQGKVAMTRVTLRPDAAFSAARAPSRDELVAMHEAAHAACFIASSVHTEVRCEPVMPGQADAPQRHAGLAGFDDPGDPGDSGGSGDPGDPGDLKV